MTYKRSRTELETNSVKWWPQYLIEAERESSIVPYLISSQDRFISILTLSNNSSFNNILDIIVASSFPANLFLKHLMVLTDFGSEPLQRVNKDFKDYFPDGTIEVVVSDHVLTHKFSKLPHKGPLTNKTMYVDKTTLFTPRRMDSLTKDLIFLLLFGGFSTDERISKIFSKCIVGGMIGNKHELSEYIKQRYIHVSRITGGATANDLGNIAQAYVCKYLSDKLGSDYKILSNGRIPGITQNDGKTDASFDVVVKHGNMYVAVEVSFQVTTNSTIERKAGQAKDRHSMLSDKGFKIAYIIDGAGNFQRTSAIDTICQYSDCTVAYNEYEFDVLVDFIREVS